MHENLFDSIDIDPKNMYVIDNLDIFQMEKLNLTKLNNFNSFMNNKLKNVEELIFNYWALVKQVIQVDINLNRV